VIVARPENETTFAVLLAAHARAPFAASLSDPGFPLRTAVPLKVTQVGLVWTPWAEPCRVLVPMRVPRPEATALPEAVPPLTRRPLPVPR
jgi:hypothetical protein